MRERFAYIDFLRAFSILGVIAIHTLSFSLGSATNLIIWNSLQFVVAIFVFCSGFVHSHYESKFTTVSIILSWYKKRAIRILMPFYLYFFMHFILFFLFPTVFTHFGLQKSISYIVSSLFLYGGINASWLPLLFLELTLLTPVFFFLKKKRTLWLYIVCSFCITAVGTLWFLPYSWYRGEMWVAWSLVFLLGLFTPRIKNTVKLFGQLAVIGGILFSFLAMSWSNGFFFLFSNFHNSLNFSDNKYPPNLYYLSYAIFGTSMLFLVSKKIIQYIPQWTYSYISKKSYSLFFIHYIVLDFFLSRLPLSPSALFPLVAATSICIQLGIDWVVMLTPKTSE